MTSLLPILIGIPLAIKVGQACIRLLMWLKPEWFGEPEKAKNDWSGEEETSKPKNDEKNKNEDAPSRIRYILGDDGELEEVIDN